MPSSNEILKSINITKDHELINQYNESDYVPYFINKAFSFYPDTLLHSNSMNCSTNLSKEMQYKYYVYAISKRNRYTPWLKFNPPKKLEIIKKYCGVSYARAKEIMPLLNEEIILEMEKDLNNRND